VPPLFPEIDVPGLIARVNGSTDPAAAGAAAPDPSGVMAGLNASLISFLRNFDPGSLGVCVVDDKLQLSLAIPNWDKFAFFQQGEITLAASQGGLGICRTVPMDERWEIQYFSCRRDTGDNTYDTLVLDYPAGYTEGGNTEHALVSLTTAATRIFWPDPAGIQTVTHANNTYPILLEPGTNLSVNPSGAGVSASEVEYEIIGTRSKIVRAMEPRTS